MAVPAENGKKVMVAIDESESSYHALMWVLKNLRDSIAASGSPLLIFMAHPFPVTSNVFAASLGSARVYCPVSATSEYAYCVQEQNKVVQMGILEKAKSICTTHGVNAETIAQLGDPKQAICDAAQKHNIDLLVLGDTELGKIQRFISVLRLFRKKNVICISLLPLAPTVCCMCIINTSQSSLEVCLRKL
ncbi:universal stress protein A-like protein isoform X1 [Rhododendron vialii]|uniref:universal stress protein A-like protein isoform X1 n=1 Tax=Rhododendron vialii TaxID=182163 RepID=UPI00265F9AB2|nr:universal stress protein A-like protein isoform X1 [Rhododendron vialii]